jgi:DNA repair protein RecO (recombination protein O)
VLQAFPYSETSKILRLYTWEHGLRSVMAKGAQRPKSRFGGLLEPFTEGVAAFYLKDGRDLHTLSGFDLIRSRQALGRSLVGFAGASLLAEMALRFGTEEPHPRLFATLADAWDAIARAPDEAQAEAASFAGAWYVAALSGYEPQMDACIACGRAVGDDEPVRFDKEGGGVACFRCRPIGRVLDAETRAELRRMLRGEIAVRLAHPEVHRALLRAFVAAQLEHDKPFRSLELLLRP